MRINRGKRHPINRNNVKRAEQPLTRVRFCVLMRVARLSFVDSRSFLLRRMYDGSGQQRRRARQTAILQTGWFHGGNGN